MEKVGLRFEHAFVYPEERLVGCCETRRRAVKYGIERGTWLSERGLE
jgi:hypothetical protein